MEKTKRERSQGPRKTLLLLLLLLHIFFLLLLYIYTLLHSISLFYIPLALAYTSFFSLSSLAFFYAWKDEMWRGIKMNVYSSKFGPANSNRTLSSSLTFKHIQLIFHFIFFFFIPIKFIDETKVYNY